MACSIAPPPIIKEDCIQFDPDFRIEGIVSEIRQNSEGTWIYVGNLIFNINIEQRLPEWLSVGSKVAFACENSQYMIELMESDHIM